MIAEKNGKLLVNVTTTAGSHQLTIVHSYGEVPKIDPITVKLHRDSIKKTTRMPKNNELSFEYKDGYALFELDIVHIHTAAAIERSIGTLKCKSAKPKHVWRIFCLILQQYLLSFRERLSP
ncbi:MAG: hypothetical protein IJ428_00340 [Clostridia bacterium]|nr:hypothetical protein [Clostridia bacterium]